MSNLDVLHRSQVQIPESETAFQPPQQACLLCVDDDRNVLSSLRRLFHRQGYRVLTADSGAAGLRMLDSEPVDVVISDMRMPEMDGVRFLQETRVRWPDMIRLLLTGFADSQSILAAINDGGIYRYLTKPWDDAGILLVVRQALEHKALLLEKRRLEKLTREQNDDLAALSASLEQMVEERGRI